MSAYTTEQIRNIALTGHAGAGKTILTDALLHAAGVIPQIGATEKGSTVSDFDDQEKERQHSLYAAICSLDHGGAHINLIDTPGAPDFFGHALGALPAVETVAVVVNAQSGIEMITRRIMERAEQRQLPRCIVINKIDADNIDLPGVVNQLQESFGPACKPFNLPSGGGAGVVDVFNKAEGEVDFSDVESAHTAILDQVVEVDEELAMLYLEGEELSKEQIHNVFEQALREGHLIPILFCSARTGAGVKELADFFAHFAPSPKEGNPRPFIKDSGEGAETFVPQPDPSGHALAHVFKVAIDPFVGRLGVFRIHQGTITKDTQLYINDAKKPFKVGHLFKLQGKDHKETNAGIPGDICAVAKVEEIDFDAVLHDSADEAGIRLKPIAFPQPMHGLAITAKSRGDEQKIAKALAAIDAEDPCFKIERPGTGETVIRGLGDLHMRVILDKMKNRYNVEVDTKPPRIAYCETVQGEASAQYRHKKQSGGAGQFGEVHLKISPLPEDSEFRKINGGNGLEFVNDIFGGAIPGQFIPAIEKGVKQIMGEGAIAGYPMQDIRVSVYDGKYHPVDSKEVAFVTATRNCMKKVVSEARPAILEPIVNLEITVPDQNMGDIAGDLSSKRGGIQGQENIPGGMIVIKAQAPLAELGNYQSQLNSVTGGQGSYSMELSHYDAVPPNVQQQLIAAFKPKEEDD